MISKGRSVGCEHLLRPSLSKYGPLERVRVRCVEKARYVCSQHKFALGADACSLDLPPAKIEACERPSFRRIFVRRVDRMGFARNYLPYPPPILSDRQAEPELRQWVCEAQKNFLGRFSMKHSYRDKTRKSI